MIVNLSLSSWGSETLAKKDSMAVSLFCELDSTEHIERDSKENKTK